MKYIVNNDIYKETCSHCNCNFIFSGNEAHHISSNINEYYIIHCPNCGWMIESKLKDMPAQRNWQRNALVMRRFSVRI